MQVWPYFFWVLGFGFWVLGFGFWVLGFLVEIWKCKAHQVSLKFLDKLAEV